MPATRPRQYDLIAFDWDGTLSDSTRIIVHCIQRAVADVGGAVPSDRDAAYLIGMGLMDALAHAAPIRREFQAVRGRQRAGDGGPVGGGQAVQLVVED